MDIYDEASIGIVKICTTLCTVNFGCCFPLHAFDFLSIQQNKEINNNLKSSLTQPFLLAFCFKMVTQKRYAI
jgi:hypothetical protein